MQFQAAQGDPRGGLQQYASFRQRLWEEMSFEPEPATVSLAARLEELQQELGSYTWEHVTTAAFRQPEDFPEPGPLPPHSILPYTRNPEFTGRESALQHLADALFTQNPQTPPVAAITGIGGMGKTQLAVEFAYRYGRYFPGGVYWMRFADPESVPAEVAATGGERGLGLFKDAEKLTLADQVGRVQRAWQEPVARLLILDNCESEELLAEWRPVTGGCRVLITSRRGVWAPDLAVQTHPLKPLDRHESVQLLTKMTTVSRSDAEAIAGETGDLPLALFLAGSFLHRYRQIAPAEYIAQLRSQGALAHPSLQGRGTSRSPTGHDLDIARTFDLNFTQLDPAKAEDRKALEILACAIAFARGEAIPQRLLLACAKSDPDDMMEEMLAIDGLTRLLSLGIVRFSGEDALQIHRVMAAYASDQLGERVSWGQTAVEKHILGLMEETFARSRFLGHLPLSSAHLQAITRTALARADDLGTHLPLWLGRYLRDVGMLEEARAILETASPIRRGLFPDGDLVLADLSNLLGTLTWEMGSAHEAWPFYEEAMHIRKRILGLSHTLTAQSIQNLGILHSRTGFLDSAMACYEQAVSIYETLDPPDRHQVGMTRYNLGLLLLRMNRFSDSVQQHQISLKIRESLFQENNPYIAQSLNSLGVCAIRMGDYHQALVYLDRALVIRRESLGEHHPQTGLTLLNIGLANSGAGKFETAETQLQDALAFLREQLPPDHPYVGLGLSFFGQHYYRAGQTDLAKNQLEAALAILNVKRSTSYETAEAHIYLAYCYLSTGDCSSAKNSLESARLIQEANLVPDHFFTSYRLLGSGDLALAEGDPQTARQLYEQAEAVFEKTALPTHADWEMIRTRLAR